MANVNNYIAAGNAAINNALTGLKAARENSPDYQGMLNKGLANQAKEKLAYIEASTKANVANIEAEGRINATQTKSDSWKNVKSAELKTKMAGKLAAASGMIAENFKPSKKIVKPTAVDYSKYRKMFNDRLDKTNAEINNLNTAELNIDSNKGNGNTSPASSVNGLATAGDAIESLGIKPANGSISQSQIKNVLMQAGFSDAEATTGAAIGMAESRGVLNADTSKTIDPNKTNEWSRGIMQINVQAHQDKLDRKGWTPADLNDPLKAAVISKEVYDEAGGSFTPWSAFTNQSYLKFQ